MIYTVEEFKDLKNAVVQNNEEEVRRILIQLRARQLTQSHQVWLDQLKKRREQDTIDRERYLNAFLAFYEFNMKEPVFQRLRTKWETASAASTFVHCHLQNEWNVLDELHNKVSIEVANQNHRLLTCLLPEMDAKINDFNAKLEGVKKHRFFYPASYANISKSNNVLVKAHALMQDYYEKNHFYYFHNRSHNAEAMQACAKIDNILNGSKQSSPLQRREEAKEYFSDLKMTLLAKKNLTFATQQQSSIIRRINKILEWVDEENQLDPEYRNMRSPRESK